LPGKSHGQRRLVGYSLWGHKESDMTERLSFPFILILDQQSGYDFTFLLLQVMVWVAQMVKNLTSMWETGVQSLGGEDPLEKGMATHFTILGIFLCTEVSFLEGSGVGGGGADFPKLRTFLTCKFSISSSRGSSQPRDQTQFHRQGALWAIVHGVAESNTTE